MCRGWQATTVPKSSTSATVNTVSDSNKCDQTECKIRVG
jgi:hypothetical protein